MADEASWYWQAWCGTALICYICGLLEKRGNPDFGAWRIHQEVFVGGAQGTMITTNKTKPNFRLQRRQLQFYFASSFDF